MLIKKKNIIFSFCTILIFLVGSESAETYNCRTTSLSSNGWSSVKVARSWFPERTTHQVDDDVSFFREWDLKGSAEKTNSGRMRLKYKPESNNGIARRITYVIYPNGQLIVQMAARSGYVPPTPSRGNCTVSYEKSSSKKRSNGGSIQQLVQAELNRLGCKVGTADGSIGPASRRGLRQFSEANGAFSYDVSVFSDRNFLKMLQGKPSGFCH